MKQRQGFIWIVLPLLGVVWWQGQQAQPPASSTTVPVAKIAVIDTSVMAEDGGIEQLVQQRKLLEERFGPQFQELQRLQQQVQSLQQEIRTKASNWTADALQKKQEEFQNLQIDLKRKSEDLERATQKEQLRVTAPIRERIQTHLQQYAKRNGITAVLDLAPLEQAGAVPYVDPATNITQDFMADYNKAYPARQPATSSR